MKVKVWIRFQFELEFKVGLRLGLDKGRIRVKKILEVVQEIMIVIRLELR